MAFGFGKALNRTTGDSITPAAPQMTLTRRFCKLLSTSLVLVAMAWPVPAGCSSTDATPSQAGYKTVLIEDVPHILQKPDFCGEACAAMWLRKLGRGEMDQDYVFDHSGLSPYKARGCYTAELAVAIKKIGFDIGNISFTVSPEKADVELEKLFAAMHADLLAGTPSIVCMHYDDKPDTTEHFRLILGYDAATDEVIYHEPAKPNAAYRRMSRRHLLKLWPLKYKPDRWTVIRIPLKAGKIAKVKPITDLTSADFAQHMMALKHKIPAGGNFTTIIEPPFVIIGDEKPAVVKRRAKATIKWASEKLKKAYFKKNPASILDIWLFKDKRSYRKHTWEIFRDRPDTPFGYYSAAHGALIMNIQTGGGTLVHEIVHPFMEANFPECPPWFNEGLGSLYEQCRDRDGQIHGLTNWRLAGLQQAIRTDALPSFEYLTAMDEEAFYEHDKGDNYAQSRYLCYYLQQEGLLRKFYHAFRKNHKTDPSGYRTLKDVLGVDDMAAFQDQWHAYILKLRFP